MLDKKLKQLILKYHWNKYNLKLDRNIKQIK